MPLREGEKRPEVGLREIIRTWDFGGCAKRTQPLSASREQKAVFEEIAFGELQHAERKREDGCIKTSGQESGHDFTAGRFYNIQFNPRLRRLKAFQQSREQIGRDG